MSGWPSKAAAAPFLATLLALAAAGALGSSVLAQSVLAQSTDAEAVGPPVVLTPPGGEAGSAPSVPAPAVERAPAGIEVDPLAEVATDYGGTLDPGAGGFPVDMWRGSDRAFVERLLPQLPVAPRSPAQRELTRRLLLSSAEAPAGPVNVNLNAVRAERLMALGERAAAAELLALVPESQRDATTARIRLEASWLAGQDEQACAEVGNLIRRFDQDPYLQKAMVFCQAKAGQTDEATLGLDLLREQGHADDETFFDLIGVLTGLRKTAKAETLGEPKGLHYALFKATGQKLPEDAAGTADPDLLAMRLATSDGAERLAATEQAALAGLADPAALAAAYGAEPVPPEELAGALDLAPDSPHARAVLYQAAAQATVPTLRASLIQKALVGARQDGSYLTAARVYLPLIQQLKPEPAIAAVAGEAGRALYFGGRYELAGAWLEMARAESGHNPDAAASVPVLWLLARIAGGAEPLVWDGKSVATWRQSQAAAGDADADLRAARLFALFDGLGEPVGAAWQVLADPAAPTAQTMPNPALWFALGDAAAAGRLGETVMLVLCTLGPDGPGAAHPIALARALAALRQVGLESEARALAFEAALASGV
jgi:hypothetical protein